jgi:hypothetical protein
MTHWGAAHPRAPKEALAVKNTQAVGFGRPASIPDKFAKRIVRIRQGHDVVGDVRHLERGEGPDGARRPLVAADVATRRSCLTPSLATEMFVALAAGRRGAASP